MLWALDASPDGITLNYPYFETEAPLVWDEGGTYVETEVKFSHNTTHEWNHGLGEIVTALMNVGFELTALVEHDSAPWEALPGKMTLDEHGEWRLTERPENLPATYTLQARLRP